MGHLDRFETESRLGSHFQGVALARDKKTGTYGALVCSPLPQRPDLSDFVQRIWKSGLRHGWWGAWTDGLPVLYPRGWWSDRSRMWVWASRPARLHSAVLGPEQFPVRQARSGLPSELSMTENFHTGTSPKGSASPGLWVH